MAREARYFECGYPRIIDGISYSYPDKKVDFKNALKERTNDLAEVLLEKFREYNTMLDICDSAQRVHVGRNGITLHYSQGGRWIEIWDMMGSHFIAGHNLDRAISLNSVAFNIGSDVLEILDPTFLAPRVMILWVFQVQHMKTKHLDNVFQVKREKL
jgi:hypothetical protein